MRSPFAASAALTLLASTCAALHATPCSLYNDAHQPLWVEGKIPPNVRLGDPLYREVFEVFDKDSTLLNRIAMAGETEFRLLLPALGRLQVEDPRVRWADTEFTLKVLDAGGRTVVDLVYFRKGKQVTPPDPRVPAGHRFVEVQTPDLFRPLESVVLDGFIVPDTDPKTENHVIRIQSTQEAVPAAPGGIPSPAAPLGEHKASAPPN